MAEISRTDEPKECDLRRFPFLTLEEKEIERFQGRLWDHGVTYDKVRDPLSRALKLLRDKNYSLSYVYRRKEIARMADVHATTVDRLRDQTYEYKRGEKMPWAPAAVLLAAVTVSDYLYDFTIINPEKADIWLDELPIKYLHEVAIPVREIRDGIEGGGRLPLIPAGPNNLSLLGAPFLRWRYTDFKFGFYSTPKLEPDGRFSLPVEKLALEWDPYNGLRDPFYVILHQGRLVAGDRLEVVLWNDENKPSIVRQVWSNPERCLPCALFQGVPLPRYKEYLRVQYKINGWPLHEARIPVINRWAALEKATAEAFAEMDLE